LQPSIVCVAAERCCKTVKTEPSVISSQGKGKGQDLLFVDSRSWSPPPLLLGWVLASVLRDASLTQPQPECEPQPEPERQQK
jgi:hypothetical protein